MQRDRGIYTLADCTFRDSTGTLRYPWGYPDGKLWHPFPYDGLVSYWKLDEMSGGVVDSHDSNTGTNYGSTRGVTGKINNGFSLDGTDDYIDTNYSKNWSESFTFNVWMATSTDNEQDVIGFYGTVISSYIQLQPDNIVRFRIRWGNTKDISFPYSDNTWHMFSLTYDATESAGKAYIDGVFIDNVDIGSHTGSSNITIGFCLTEYGLFLDGKVDEVGVWCRAITPNEVSALFNNGSGLEYI